MLLRGDVKTALISFFFLSESLTNLQWSVTYYLHHISKRWWDVLSCLGIVMPQLTDFKKGGGYAFVRQTVLVESSDAN